MGFNTVYRVWVTTIVKATGKCCPEDGIEKT
jgi:hypothetical protein